MFLTVGMKDKGLSKMMNQICLLFLFVNYSLEEKRKRNKESHSQFHSRYCSKPVNPIISAHILLTVLCTFPMVLVMRVCWTNQVSFPFFSWPLSLNEQGHCKNKILNTPGCKESWFYGLSLRQVVAKYVLAQESFKKPPKNFWWAALITVLL